MKLPRWLVISLLALTTIALFAAPVWWWVSWPGESARNLVAEIGRENFREAERYLSPSNRWVLLFVKASDFELEARTQSDLVAGRCRFKRIVLPQIDGRVFWADMWFEKGKLHTERGHTFDSTRGDYSMGARIDFRKRVTAQPSWLAGTVSENPDDSNLCETLYVQLLGRSPNRQESRAALAELADSKDRLEAAEILVWEIVTSSDFFAPRRR